MGFKRHIQAAPKVDLTPMIDVVFLLLIFFMISTTFIERPGLDIDLPTASSEQIKQKNKEVQVYLAKNGDIYLYREPVSQDDFERHIGELPPRETATMTFLLMADKAAQHGKVVALMDIAKRAGFKTLAIATDKVSEK